MRVEILEKERELDAYLETQPMDKPVMTSQIHQSMENDLFQI